MSRVESAGQTAGSLRLNRRTSRAEHPKLHLRQKLHTPHLLRIQIKRLAVFQNRRRIAFRRFPGLTFYEQNNAILLEIAAQG